MWHSLQFKKNGNCYPLGTEKHITIKTFQQAQLPTGDCNSSCLVECGALVFGEIFPNFGRPSNEWETTHTRTPPHIPGDFNLNVVPFFMLMSVTNHFPYGCSFRGPKYRKTNWTHLPTGVCLRLGSFDHPSTVLIPRSVV